MFKYYHSRGMKMSNLEFCVEYSRDKPIADFVQQMTEHRKQATRDGNKELQMLYKVCKFQFRLYHMIYVILLYPY